jgi:hypothetical protein
MVVVSAAVVVANAVVVRGADPGVGLLNGRFVGFAEGAEDGFCVGDRDGAPVLWQAATIDHASFQSFSARASSFNELESNVGWLQ